MEFTDEQRRIARRIVRVYENQKQQDYLDSLDELMRVLGLEDQDVAEDLWWEVV